MPRGLGALRFLAAPGLVLAPAADTHKALSGLVVDVDRENGTVTLQRTDGTRARLRASQRLLREVRSGERAKAVVEGKSVRLLTCL